MRLDDMRSSSNVEDRRRSGGGQRLALGGGLGGIVIALIAVFVFKVDPSQLANMSGGGSGEGGEQRELTAEEVALGEMVTKILGGTEDVWRELYPRMAADPKFRGAPRAYEEPVLEMFSGSTPSACGTASAASGPFYCPGDHKVYIDLSFYDQLKRQFKAPGDFAQAYVIAHEVGHHVQNLLGLSDYVHQQRRQLSDDEYNRLSVRLELQADYLAGVWANRAQQKFNFLERGDVEEALNAAGAIGDDNIQKQTQGHVVPDSFTHGTSEQRIRWFSRGLKSGDPLAHDPFTLRYEDL